MRRKISFLQAATLMFHLSYDLIQTPMKYQEFLGIYYETSATVIFSRLKTNLLFSHVKTDFARKLAWYFIGVYIKKRELACEKLTRLMEGIYIPKQANMREVTSTV